MVTAPKLDVAPVIPPMEVVGSTLVALRRSKWWKPDYSVKECPAEPQISFTTSHYFPQPELFSHYHMLCALMLDLLHQYISS